MSLPLPDAFAYRGGAYFLEGANGRGLTCSRDFGLPYPPGWNAYRQTYALHEGRLVVREIEFFAAKGQAPPVVDGVAPQPLPRSAECGWRYDLCRPVPFEGYLLFGNVSLRNDRLASLPLPYVGAGGVHFELGFIGGEVFEEIDLTEPVARLFAPEVAMKRKRVKDADVLALLDLLERRYRITPF